MTNSRDLHCRVALFLVIACASTYAQSLSGGSGGAPASTPASGSLIDAPQPQPASDQIQAQAKQMALAPIPPARKYAEVIEPGQQAYQFTATDKLIFSFTEVARPITILPSLYSASYEQIFETDPKYGHDAGAFGEKFGASMLRRASLRVFSDGIFPEVFHQDPRYYRAARGSAFHRSWNAVRQVAVRRGDDGNNQFNYSGIIGRAVSAGLVVTYYPEPSVTAKVVGSTFGYSLLSDAGGNLLLEFLPNIIRKFPIMRQLRLE